MSFGGSSQDVFKPFNATECLDLDADEKALFSSGAESWPENSSMPSHGEGPAALKQSLAPGPTAKQYATAAILLKRLAKKASDQVLEPQANGIHLASGSSEADAMAVVAEVDKVV